MPDDLIMPDVEEVEEVVAPDEEEVAEEVEESTEDESTEETTETAKPETKSYRSQEEFDRALQARLAREKRKMERELIQHAGTELTSTEVPEAVRLWGFLKQHPELSKRVSEVINGSPQARQQPQPQGNYFKQQLQEIELKEAVMDLKAEDAIFRKHEREIEDWVDEQGIQVTDAKSLKVAYLAWKGQNYRKDAADTELAVQRKMQDNLRKKKNASVLPAKAQKATASLDYSKLSPQDILKAEGLSLFKEE